MLMKAITRIHVWPLTREVCLNMLALDFSSDPADELIAATSLAYGARLVTRDERIRKSRMVEFA
jgi:PIN domain nuclease of toxin-antitoxin system